MVKQGRGDRLKDMPDIFSGIVWTGQKSIDLGLADELGSAEYVAREIIRAEVLVDFTAREGFADLFAKKFSQVMMTMLSGSEWILK